MAPDWPRLPPAWVSPASDSIAAALARTTRSLELGDSVDTTLALRAALAVTLAAHAGEGTYAFATGEAQVRGELRSDDDIATLVGCMQNEDPGTADSRICLEFADGRTRVVAQKTVLKLVASRTTVALDFDPTVLSALEADWFLSHLSTAFSAISSSPRTTKISQISLLAAGEREVIASLSHSAAPPSAYPPSCTHLAAFFLHTSAINPHAIAIQFDDTTLSYAQLEHLARRFAQHLVADARVRPGSIVPGRRLRKYPPPRSAQLAGLSGKRAYGP